MSPANLSIVGEIDTALTAASEAKGLDAVRRVTDLFLSSAGLYNSEQIELFDNVLGRLIRTIEIRAIADISARIALAELSTQLAPVSQAPPSVIRRLARNDEITIAGPVLTESARLSAEDLVEIAKTKSEQHLLAVSGRIINNPGARVSAAGFAIVLAQAESDPELAVETGIRADLPSELRQEL